MRVWGFFTKKLVYLTSVSSLNIFKKREEMVVGSCGAVCVPPPPPHFVSTGEIEKVDVTQGFVSLPFKTIIETNVQ